MLNIGVYTWVRLVFLSFFLFCSSKQLTYHTVKGRTARLSLASKYGYLNTNWRLFVLFNNEP